MDNTTPSISDVITSELEVDDSTLPIKNEEETKPSTEEVTEEVTEETPDDKTEEVKTETKEETPSTEEDESFTTFNPKDLTPELQQVYKKWQSDYTQTRQREKQELRDLKDKVAQLEQPSNRTQNEKVEDFKNAKATGEIRPDMSFQEYSRLLIDKAKEEFKQEYKVDQENEYIENQEREFMSLDARFAEGPARDKILLNHVASELGILRETFEKENGTIIGFDFISNAKELIENYDNRISQANKNFIEKQNKLVKDKAEKSKKANPSAKNTIGDSKGNMSLESAITEAYSQT